MPSPTKLRQLEEIAEIRRLQEVAAEAAALQVVGVFQAAARDEFDFSEQLQRDHAIWLDAARSPLMQMDVLLSAPAHWAWAQGQHSRLQQRLSEARQTLDSKRDELANSMHRREHADREAGTARRAADRRRDEETLEDVSICTRSRRLGT